MVPRQADCLKKTVAFVAAAGAM